MKSVTVESSLGLSLDKLGEKLHESMKAQEMQMRQMIRRGDPVIETFSLKDDDDDEFESPPAPELVLSDALRADIEMHGL